MKFALFDDPITRQNLLPFTYTRPGAEIRLGIMTIREKWEHYLKEKASFVTEQYLQNKFQGPESWADLLLINGGVIPTAGLISSIEQLDIGYALAAGNIIIAAKLNKEISIDRLKELKLVEYQNEINYLERPWQIFKLTGEQIRADFKLLTNKRKSEIIADSNTVVYGKDNIFLEAGVSIKSAVIDAENGPVYLGKNSTIEPGAIIRGPFALGEGSTINALGNMRGDISIGPFCKVGGEVSNSVFFANSNKGHDGFMGNSVLGEWCNIGAGTNTSNLKNNYAKVKVWDYRKGGFIDTGEQFCGLLMGDHCKTAIGTTLNTGTVTGVACNIFGAGFPRTFLPSFSWGGFSGLITFRPNKVKEMAVVSMARRGVEFTDDDEAIIKHIFEATSKHRSWEN